MATDNAYQGDIWDTQYDPVSRDDFFKKDGSMRPIMDRIYAFMEEHYEEQTGNPMEGLYLIGGIAKAYHRQDDSARKDLDLLIESATEDEGITEYMTLAATKEFGLPIDVYVGPLEDDGNAVDLESLL